MKNFVLFLSICCSFVLNCNQAYAAKKRSSNASSASRALSDVWKGGKKIKPIWTKDTDNSYDKELLDIRQKFYECSLLQGRFRDFYEKYDGDFSTAPAVRERDEFKKDANVFFQKMGSALVSKVDSICYDIPSRYRIQSIRSGRNIDNKLTYARFVLAEAGSHLKNLKKLRERREEDTHDSDSEEEVINKISQMNLKEES